VQVGPSPRPILAISSAAYIFLYSHSFGFLQGRSLQIEIFILVGQKQGNPLYLRPFFEVGA
jgi:hypothetical protein